MGVKGKKGYCMNSAFSSFVTLCMIMGMNCFLHAMDSDKESLQAKRLPHIIVPEKLEENSGNGWSQLRSHDVYDQQPSPRAASAYLEYSVPQISHNNLNVGLQSNVGVAFEQPFLNQSLNQLQPNLMQAHAQTYPVQATPPINAAHGTFQASVLAILAKNRMATRTSSIASRGIGMHDIAGVAQTTEHFLQIIANNEQALTMIGGAMDGMNGQINKVKYTNTWQQRAHMIGTFATSFLTIIVLIKSIYYS
jgi:hypothetical protein